MGTGVLCHSVIAPVRKGCLVLTISMNSNAHLVASSSQSQEMGAMEKQVQPLTASIQELTCENQVLMQKLLWQETDKVKGKEKEKRKKGCWVSKGAWIWNKGRKYKGKYKDDHHGFHNKVGGRNEGNEGAGEIRDSFRGRTTRNLDNLVHRTDSPFTEEVLSYPLPFKFWMPPSETFDGAKDPLDHLESFLDCDVSSRGPKRSLISNINDFFFFFSLCFGSFQF